ncbi:hypothetical protein [Lutibacter sp.]
MSTMKKITFILIFCTSILYAQQYRIGLNSSITTSISENNLNLINYKPDTQYMYFYSADFRIKILKKYNFFSGINFQFGNKTIGKGFLYINYTLNNLDIDYVTTKRDINILFFKIPLIYSMPLNEFVKVNLGLYLGWTQFKLDNKGSIILKSGEKYTEINDIIYKDKFFIEPLLELDVKLIPFFNFNFEITYKRIEYLFNTDLPDFYNLNFATEKFKYKLNGLYYSIGLYINI